MSGEITIRKRSIKQDQGQREGLLTRGLGPRSLAPLVGLDHRHLPTGFERWRSELSQLSGMRLLDAMTAPTNAAACVQTLPIEDLHRCLYEIGLEDAEAVLALANAEQVRGLLDVELWERSDLSLSRLDVWMFALMRAGKDVLYQRVLDLDDSLLNWVIKQNAYAFELEDPDDFDPPLAEHMLTPDRRLCIVFPRSVDHLADLNPSVVTTPHAKGADEEIDSSTSTEMDAPLNGGDKDRPIRVFIDLLMQEQPEFCINLLLAASAALNSTLEEEAYRWRCARLADRGFVEYYEAREIYTPPPADWKRSLPPERIDEEAPPAKRWLARVIATSERLDHAFAALSWSDALTVAELLGYVANTVLSADRVALWDHQRQEQSLRRLQSGLTIALELLNGPDATPQRDAETLSRYHLNYLFRLGYEQMIEAARPVWRVEHTLRRGDDLSATLDELPRLKLWADALLGDHPEGRGERGEAVALRSLNDCKVAREGALIIEDIARVAQPLYAELLVEVKESSEESSEAESSKGSARSTATTSRGAVGMGPLIFTAYWRDRAGATREVEEVANPHLTPLSTSEVRALQRQTFPQASSLELKSSSQSEEVGSPSPVTPISAEERLAFCEWWAHRGGVHSTAPLALLRELEDQLGGVHPTLLEPRFIPLMWWDGER